MEIKESTEIPEIYKRLNQKFGVEWNDGIIIANGDTIHCRYKIPAEKMVHEIQHLRQQEKMGLDLWWEMYLSDDAFRLDQEVLAYRREYQFLKDNIKDRELVSKMKRDMAIHLASSTYGNLISVVDGLRLI